MADLRLHSRIIVEDPLRLLRRVDAVDQYPIAPSVAAPPSRSFPWSKSRWTYAKCCSITALSSGVIEARKSGLFGLIVEIYVSGRSIPEMVARLLHPGDRFCVWPDG